MPVGRIKVALIHEFYVIRKDFQPRRRSHREASITSTNFHLTPVPHSNIPFYKYASSVFVSFKLTFTLKPSSPEVCRKMAFRWCLLCSSSHRASSWPRNSSILALPGCRARTSPRPSWGESIKLMGPRWWLTAICVGQNRHDVMQKVTKLSATIRLTLRPGRTRCPDQQRALIQYWSVSKEKWKWRCVLAYSLHHLYPGPVGQDLLFQSLLAPLGGFQSLKTGYRAHLSGHGHVIFQPRQSLKGQGSKNAKALGFFF